MCRYALSWIPETRQIPSWTSDDPLIYKILQSDSDVGLKLVNQKASKIGLPDVSWIWSEESWILLNGDGKGRFTEDPEFWFYANSWHSTEFAEKKALSHFVRRRFWSRTRRLKTASEFVDEMLSQGFNEIEILKAFRSIIENLHDEGVLLKV